MPLHQKIIRFARTLRGYVLISIMAVSIVVFLSVTLTATLLYEDVIHRQSAQTSESIAQSTFNSMFQVMRQGWTRQELEVFLSETKATYANTPFDIEIYRGSKVEALFGVIDQPDPDAAIQQVFQDGLHHLSQTDHTTRRLFPLKVRAECLQCHRNAKPGDVLGVIDIRQDMSPIRDGIRQGYIALFIIAAMVIMFAALGISASISVRIKQSMERFKHQLKDVNSVKDFRALDTKKVDFFFDEFNQAFSHVSSLMEKLKDVAVDKDILEFEIRLLSKFIITSEVVRDWRDFIKDLLVDINTIIEAHTLVTIFQVDDEGYELEVFWYQDVTEETRTAFEVFLRTNIENDEHFHKGAVILSIAHHVAHPEPETLDLKPITPKDIELQTKSLLLEAPKIGGVVGIGVQSDLARDPIRHIVIDGILTTLLNLVGSVKAIYKYTQDLEFYATRDPLTSLHNQRMFKELLGYEVGRASRHKESFALLMLDLDNFKTVNDRFGHAYGDQFLQAFARVLEHSVRPGDFLSRYGGDEFTIILPEASQEQAFSVAQRIKHAIDQMHLKSPDGQPMRATGSMGIAVYPDHASNPRDLFLLADNMMYKAKRLGRNSIAVPDDDEVAEVYKEAGAKNIMVLNALEEERIVPYFQPIVDSETGDVEIHELLMRIEMDHRIVPAGEFIDIAEGIGVVHKMDYMLIEKAFDQMVEQGYTGKLFVNLSPKSLIVSEFIGRIRQLAQDKHIAPDRIVFELTERETVSNLNLLEKFVLDLKLEGFNFAIDDFGSGFSSFHYIKHFPIDVIKIEGEFIRNMLHDDKYMAFVKSIVTLAQNLGIKTIAEFIEDEDIMDKVRELGIDYGQGFYLGRPAGHFVCSQN
ncbi:putative bifunctional diguanylate cyclase/phosphodiesterase [Oceanospirillum linum]|uniref:GGDEF-domain containing protein n=1 Tax=Oceanospirillum linum TaxID=966 RepID=A0A1T1HAL1_OCELI|nr:bifunctional diguanylate cyclase/phosphodiesterase [Oceanospirillum linum]OOV86780.1 GGDEF-domain containing protein [Oceanospirillum linum]SEG22718.1 diguanylate cyclase (GGDEF) domain-containing protein [Oleiphilus messinensis]SMP25428.1 diguanylate cyclase/phosphodiesterase [Oceanospirillum linum]